MHIFISTIYNTYLLQTAELSMPPTFVLKTKLARSANTDGKRQKPWRHGRSAAAKGPIVNLSKTAAEKMPVPVALWKCTASRSDAREIAETPNSYCLLFPVLQRIGATTTDDVTWKKTTFLRIHILLLGDECSKTERNISQLWYIMIQLFHLKWCLSIQAQMRLELNRSQRQLYSCFIKL